MLPQMFASADLQEFIGQRQYEESFQRLSAALNDDSLPDLVSDSGDESDGEYSRCRLLNCVVATFDTVLAGHSDADESQEASLQPMGECVYIIVMCRLHM